MLSRIFVARGISCLASSTAAVNQRVLHIPRRAIRFFSTDSQQEEPVSASPAVEAVANVETVKADEVVNNTNETPTQEPQTGDMDKQFLEDLLSSISVETKTAKQRKQLVFDFATIMMDPSFKQLYSTLSKSLPPQYFNDKGLLPTIKKEFIARIQEEIIKGSFLPLDPDSSLQGLDEKKRSMVKDNTIIQTASTEDSSFPIPIPSWIWNEVMQEKEAPVEEKVETEKVEPVEEKAEETAKEENAEKTAKEAVKEEKAEPVEHYDTNKNNKIEEMLDTFGEWPFKMPEELQEETPVKRGTHHSGSFVTKNIIVNKKGQRIAYGGGKRKNSVARVYIRDGKGSITINGKNLIEAFPMGQNRDQVLAPLAVTLTYQKFDIQAIVTGGGTSGQSQAIRMALSKALSHYDPTYSVLLSKAGLLTADPRKVESKKPGHTKARKPQQWVKR